MDAKYESLLKRWENIDLQMANTHDVQVLTGLNIESSEFLKRRCEKESQNVDALIFDTLDYLIDNDKS